MQKRKASPAKEQ